MRIDKYLKLTRLIKRRTAANEACDSERITVNGRTVKASYQVKLGDRITVAYGTHTVTVEVTGLAESVKKDEALNLYREV